MKKLLLFIAVAIAACSKPEVEKNVEPEFTHDLTLRVSADEPAHYLLQSSTDSKEWTTIDKMNADHEGWVKFPLRPIQGDFLYYRVVIVHEQSGMQVPLNILRFVKDQE